MASVENENPVKKDSSSLSLWRCRIEGKPAEGQWTVGEIFDLQCEGPGVEFLSTNLQFKGQAENQYKQGHTGVQPERDHETQYKIRILEVLEDSGHSLHLKATSYKPGSHRFKKLYIVDQGEEMVRVQPLAFHVKSVIKNPLQEAFGPITAVKLPYPLWLWAVFIFPLIMGIFCFLFWWRRRAQMLGVIEELKQHNTALGPFNQLNKDLRRLERQSVFRKADEWSDSKKKSYIESLDHLFRMYLLREFYVPALDWSSGLVTKTLSRQDKHCYKQYGDSLKNFLKELDRGQK